MRYVCAVPYGATYFVRKLEVTVSFQRSSWYETNDLAIERVKIVDQAESLRMKSAAVPLSDPKMLLLGIGRPVVRGNGMQVGAAKCKHSCS